MKGDLGGLMKTPAVNTASHCKHLYLIADRSWRVSALGQRAAETPRLGLRARQTPQLRAVRCPGLDPGTERGS